MYAAAVINKRGCIPMIRKNTNNFPPKEVFIFEIIASLPLYKFVAWILIPAIIV